MMKKADFLNVDTCLWKVEVDWKVLEWVLCSQDSKIGCMSRKNE